MSDLNLENIVGFKAVDKDGNEQNVTVDEMVDMVSTRMVMALSETSTFAAAAATGNDVYENELPTVTDAANVRVLQSSGDAAKMTMQSLASKLGELIGVNYLKKAFDYKNIILGSNESYELGICAGLVVIRNIYISAAFSLLLIDEFHNAVTTIAGNSIKELGLEFRFDTTDYKARMSIINVSSNNANIEISYQNLSF
ncbi:hypothetical protein [Phocaeicola vulgatus]|uniref:hypothetical protein n=2 Tax=Phocaeicola vulgatus TaxID=821 RepID=UPI0021AAED27|nr:hypothetical protein [Phocaeicola vulgatus]